MKFFLSIVCLSCRNGYHCHWDTNACTSSATVSTDWSTSTIGQLSDNTNGETTIGDYYQISSSKTVDAIVAFPDSRILNGDQTIRIYGDRTAGGVGIYAEDCSGNYINGMAVGLYDATGNTLLKSGFTPLYIAINQTNNYVVKYNNYGSNIFVSAVPMPLPVTSYTQYTSWGGSVNVQLTDKDNYSVTGKYNTASGTSCGTTGTITVNSIRNDNGQAITGLFVQLTDQNNNVLATGYTPITFTQNAGTYIAYPNDFAPYYFDHWADNGSTIRGRTINLAANQEWQLTAVYRVQ